MTKILLKDGQIVSSQGVFDRNVLIEDGKIIDIFSGGKNIAGKVEEIYCGGKLILPGLIDAHVHMREPGLSYKEDWITGSTAAVCGGVTTVLDMPNNKPPVLSVKDLEKKRKLINGRTYVNYGLYIGYNGENIDEINKAENVAGIKVYEAHSTGDMGVVLESIEELFKNVDKKIVVHAEDEDLIEANKKAFLAEFKGREIDPSVHSKIRSPEVAAKAVEFVCYLAGKYNKPIHIAHVSTEAEVEIIKKYRKLGITCEVAPHHLALSADDYSTLGNLIKINPPVRDRMDIFSVWKALKFGDIDIIATDHAPHTLEEKKKSYLEVPSGVPELDTFLPMFLNTVNDEGLTISELVLLCCERPAEIFKIKNKGKIEAGFDADLVVVDMDLEKKVSKKTLHTKCKWSPYQGLNFKGWPIMTFVNGELVARDGKIVGEKTGGEIKFLK